jgi:hypothetical protein
MKFTITGEMFHWRGPAPFYFVAVPEIESKRIKEISQLVTYGWGVIPVTAKVGKRQWVTSLMPKDGRYLVPIKNEIRLGEGLEESDSVKIQLTIDVKI